MVSLMLRMCRPIFGSGKAVILEIGFCVAKGITYIEAKDFYVEYLIQKRCYWPKGVHDDLIGAHFEDKEVGNVGTTETNTEDNKLFKHFL